MLKVKQGDFGIRINISHNALGTIHYTIDGIGEQALVNNQYLVLQAENTAALGDHEIEFTDDGEGTHVTSFDTFKYKVVEEV
jgi:hypothetical protein